MTAVEPYMSFLPQEKNVFVRRMSPFLLHLFAFIAGHVEFAKRVLFLVTREQNFHIENLFPVIGKRRQQKKVSVLAECSVKGGGEGSNPTR